MRAAWFACAVAACLSAGPVLAQYESREGIALQNQILELRRDLQALQQQRGGGLPPPVVRGGGGGGSEISAQLLERIGTLEEEVRRLRGALDEQAFAARRAQDELGKRIAELNFRLENGGATATRAVPGGEAAAQAAGQAASTAAAQPGRRPPELAMQEGNAALARRDYAMAEAAAREVLAGGRGARSTDAQLLLAQALLGKRDAPGAAIAYDDAYRRAPTGARAPDALLGLAGTMLALNDRAAACDSLDRLRTQFPALRPAAREEAAALRGRAGCR